MSIFDKLFERNALDRKMDNAFEYFVENNPVSKKAKAAIDEAKEEITRSLEEELYEETGERKKNADLLNEEDEEALLKEWDHMFDRIFEHKLRSLKICPSCGEAASAELDICPNCGAGLPETTALEHIK